MPMRNYIQPYFNSHTEPLEIQESRLTVQCGGCHYQGPARQITGRSPKPILVCPNCRRVVQVLEKKHAKE